MATPKEVLSRIAQLALLDVPQRQIAQSVNLSESRVSQLVATDEYRAILSELSLEHHEKQALVNDGWDALEAKAISGLLDHMALASDPNLMLRVAAIANKATRRGQFQNNPLQSPGAAGARVVINLQQTFIDRLQSNYAINSQQQAAATIEQKRNDVISSAKLQMLLASDAGISGKTDILSHNPKEFATALNADGSQHRTLQSVAKEIKHDLDDRLSMADLEGMLHR